MKTSLNQRGSSHLLIFLALAVIAVVGIVAYRVQMTAAPSATSSLASRSGTVPKTVKSQADLKKANSALDSTAIDSSVDPNSLNSDLNSLQ